MLNICKTTLLLICDMLSYVFSGIITSINTFFTYYRQSRNNNCSRRMSTINAINSFIHICIILMTYAYEKNPKYILYGLLAIIISIAFFAIIAFYGISFVIFATNALQDIIFG